MIENGGKYIEPLIEPLTRREREILALLDENLTGREIAEKLTIATSSVKWHIRQIYGKLGVHSRRQAVGRAYDLGLLGDAHPPASLPRPNHNLPHQLTSYIGREREIETVQHLLQNNRLVTLTGSGGTGKTRLALQAVAELVDRFADGVWLAELAPLSDPAQVPTLVGRALSVRELTGDEMVDLLQDYLGPLQVLLILDNCEHVIEACARLATTLLETCPRLTILVTSRETLGIPGEVPFRVPPMRLPSFGETHVTPPFDELAQSEAIRLFVERATTVSPSFALNAGNTPAVLEICQRLDGIPLAIELAAARVKLLQVGEIAQHLDDRFRLLTRGSRLALPRHQTLSASIDWSYALLSQAERSLLQKLSVFTGGWVLEAAEAIGCGQNTQASDVLELLGMLVDKSLVQVSSEAGGLSRYRMLDTIRQYAYEKLVESGQAEAARQHHLQYYLDLAEQVGGKIRGPNQAQILDRLETELDNLRQALAWSLEGRGRPGWDPEPGLRLASALHWFWQSSGRGEEGIQWLEQLLAGEMEERGSKPFTPERTRCRARALFVTSVLVIFTGEYPKASRLSAESRQLYQSLGAEGRLGFARAWYAYFCDPATNQAELPGILESALVILREANDRFWLSEFVDILGEGFDEGLALKREIGDQEGVGGFLFGEVTLADRRGDYQRSRALLAESNRIFSAIHSNYFVAHTNLDLAEYDILDGTYMQAEAQVSETLPIGRRLGHAYLIHRGLVLLGRLELLQGNTSQAADRFMEDLDYFRKKDHKLFIQDSLFWLGCVAWSSADLDQASRMFNEALTISEEVNSGIKRIALRWLGKVAYGRGKPDKALDYFKQALEMPLRFPSFPVFLDNLDIPMGVLEDLAILVSGTPRDDAKRYALTAQKQDEIAVRLLGATQAWHAQFIHARLPGERQEREECINTLRSALDEQTFSAAWAAGEALSEEQAVVEALAYVRQKVEADSGLNSRGHAGKRSVEISRSPSELHIQLLGGFSITLGEVRLQEADIHSRRARSLIKLLALAPGHHLHRDQVIDALWPESALAAGTNNLHQTLYAARKTLEPLVPDCLTLEEGILSLSGGSGAVLVVDVDQFEAAAADASGSPDPQRYQAALAQYTNELLPADRYVAWAVRRREELEQVYLKLLAGLAEFQEAAGDYPDGIQTWQLLLGTDPDYEEAHMALMRLYALSGYRRQALRQYQTLSEVLQADFDLEPSPATTQLYEAIQSGRFGMDLTPTSPTETDLTPESSEARSLPKGKPPLEREIPPLQERSSSEEGDPASLDTGVRFPTITLTPPNNLPIQLTSFIGREKEIAQVVDLLRRHRLVTLTGSGGVGKTRLSIRVAGEMLNEFTDGIRYVELAPLSDPEQVSQAVAAVLGLQSDPGRPIRQVLSHFLSTREMLLVLDNCEHLLATCVQLADYLLRNAPKIKVLASSREALGITGECTFRVPSLSIPETSQSPRLETMQDYEAVRLFTERARAVLPTFQVTAGNAPFVAQICQRLDGIPLALELAAARLNLLTTQQLANRLDDAFRLLTGGSSAALPRQQTLREAIDWSYQLLSEPERLLLQRLTVFAGRASLEGIEAVCSGAGLKREDILNLLSDLVGKSMVEVERVPDVEARYRLLETVRQYAHEKLLVSEESTLLRDQHLEYFARFAEARQRQLHSPDYLQAIAGFEAALDNLRAALDWGLGSGISPSAADAELAHGIRAQGMQAHGMRIAVALTGYFAARGLYSEWAGLVDSIQALPDQVRIPTDLRARVYLSSQQNWNITNNVTYEKLVGESLALFRQGEDRQGLGLALLHYGRLLCGIESHGPYSGDRATGMDLMQEGITLLETLGEVAGLGWAWFGKGQLAYAQNDIEAAKFMLEKSIACFEDNGDQIIATRMKMSLAFVAINSGMIEYAQVYFIQCLDFYRQINNRLLISAALGFLGEIDILHGDFTGAEAIFLEVQALRDEVGILGGWVWATGMLGKIAVCQGRFRQARQRLLLSQSQGRKLPRRGPDGKPGNPSGDVEIILWLGILAQAEGQPECAARLLGAIEAILETFFKPLDPIDQNEFDRVQRKLREALDRAAFETAWAAGRQLTFEQALEEALAYGRQGEEVGRGDLTAS